jgi:hypothetical protein
MYIEVILENKCFILFFYLWHLSVTLTFTTDTWIFHLTLPFHFGEHLYRFILKSLFVCGSYSPDTDFALTPKFDLDLVLCATHHPIMVNICTKLFCYPSKNEQDTVATNYLTSCDLDLHFRNNMENIFVILNTIHVCRMFYFVIWLWPLRVTLTFTTDTWFFHSTLPLTIENICTKLY